MARFTPIDPAQAEGKAKTLLDGVTKSLGMTPNMMATMAHSPAVLGAYLGFGQTLGSAKLSGALREQIALAVAGANACEYCASAHTLLGKGAGVGEDELARNLASESTDPRTQAALTFAKSVVTKRGFVSDAEVQNVRDAGFGDDEVLEIIATVALNIFTNYFNHVTQVENDFPKVEVGEPVTA